MRNRLSNTIKEIKAVQPRPNDLTRGWEDAELQVKYDPGESRDWRLGWTAYHANYGCRHYPTWSRH